MWSIAKLHLIRFYRSLTGWLSLGLAQFLLAWLLFTQLEIYLKIQPQLTAQNSRLGVYDLVIAPVFATAALALIIILPLLSLNLHHAGRFNLYFAAPIPTRHFVLGQWLGLMLSALPLIGLVLLLTGSLAGLVYWDWGYLIAASLGLLLLAAWVSAFSLYLSSIMEQPLAATSLSWSILILLWLLDAQSSWRYLSLDAHLQAFWQGQVRLQDLIYFSLLTIAALLLSAQRLMRLKGEE